MTEKCIPKNPGKTKKGGEQMLTLIGLAFVIYLIAEHVSIDAGAVAFLIVIGLLIILCIRIGRRDARAYGNWVEYWEKGGSDRRGEVIQMVYIDHSDRRNSVDRTEHNRRTGQSA